MAAVNKYASEINRRRAELNFENIVEEPDHHGLVSDDYDSADNNEPTSDRDDENGSSSEDMLYYSDVPAEPLNSESDARSDDDVSPVNQNTDPEPSLQEYLAGWSVEFGITHEATDDLLRALNDRGHDLPRTKRTLVGHVAQTPMTNKFGGQYFYLGIQRSIEMEFRRSRFCSEVVLDINIDGLPPFNKSKSKLMPILAWYEGVDPFIVGGYYGRRDPDDANGYLHDLVAELDVILVTPLTYSNMVYEVRLRSFICDAPARAYLKGIVSHTGYFSCERCTIKGSWLGRVSFHKTEETEARTDSLFRRFHYHKHRCKCHQHKETALLRIPKLDLIKDFVLDSMHLVFLGVMRRMLYFMKGTVKGLRRARLSSHQKREFEGKLGQCSGRFPSEFVRQPRPLDDLDYWKATELRSFLLYSGLVVLKGTVSSSMFTNFLYLSVAIRYLSLKDDGLRNQALDYSRTLLDAFSKNSRRLYGSAFVVYNVHSLIHIPDDVHHFNKPLQHISAFKFENRLQGIKQSIRGKRYILEQVYRRNEEKLENGKRKQMQSLKMKIATTAKDSCFMTSTRVLFVVKLIGDQVKCRSYLRTNLDNLFIEPLPSMSLGIYQIHARCRASTLDVSKDELVRKCVCLPYKDGYVVIPMVHQD